MKNLKFVIDTKSLLKLVDAAALLSHFTVQQDNAFANGKITRIIPKRKLEAYAEECHESLRRELRDCNSPKDAVILYNQLSKVIGPHRMNFINAVWQGNKKATMEFLNS